MPSASLTGIDLKTNNCAGGGGGVGGGGGGVFTTKPCSYFQMLNQRSKLHCTPVYSALISGMHVVICC